MIFLKATAIFFAGVNILGRNIKGYKKCKCKNGYMQYIVKIGVFLIGKAYWEGVKKNDFWRYFPIVFENRGIVSYATNEHAMAWFH